VSGEANQNDGASVETPWLTVEELAAYLSVSPGTVRNWVSQEYIPHARRGRVLRFHKDRIDDWLAAGACKGRKRLAPPVAVRHDAG